MADYKKLERYGIIGNLDTCALIGDDGSIDWCCFPHIESPSVFAALLDAEKGGYFRISPEAPFKSEQRYIENTNVLQTRFSAPSGTATLTDFMPLKGWDKKMDSLSHQAIYRMIACEQGSIDIHVSFEPRFDYARASTSISLADGGALAIGNGELLFLNSSLALRKNGGGIVGRQKLNEGDSAWLVLQYGHDTPMSPQSCEDLLNATIQFWLDWGHKCERSMCVFDGPWHDQVARSGLLLKLLTHQETGAIVAAPTTSLPEEIGGARNWDYRYNWLRDASFTVQALYNVGHVAEAKKHLSWFMDICEKIKDPAETKILYGLHGETDLDEHGLDHLSGYRDSRPVRIGNAAVSQKQLDIYGELVSAIYETSRLGEDIAKPVWDFFKKIVDHVCEVWETKDAGIWEMRGGARHFVYSKLMCWVALDRGIKIAKQRDFKVPLDKWEKTAESIRDAVITKGFDHKLNSFVQSYGSTILDATSLLIPMMGFLPFDDPRVQGTIDAVLGNLMTKKGLVYRYIGDDGLPGKEGTFILCTFWLVDALSLSGRVEEAERIFLNVLKYISPLGLFSEEIDNDTGELLGNFPQAFSHIGLMNSALYLGRARGRKQMGPEPLGDGKR